ncbi:MAG TPA: DUF4405 domain-containing protein [Gemmataceae bacterium]|nr:DUF4405 domain-containing protein [Gemmataceae bacterium]
MQTSTEADSSDSAGLGVARSEEPKPERRKLSMAFINFCLDTVLASSVMFVGWVSAMMQVVFPAPTSAAGWRLWGLSFDQWRNAQFYSICVCAVIILLHVMLHWNWVCGIVATQILRIKTRPNDGVQKFYGVVAMIVVLHIILAGIVAALLTVKRPA